MRLKQIKLAGFKSFVDLTKVPFPHQMTAIVGPNGCGKSNIIDAVRWVLGESSAKNLRGDAMTDVIFNGAASRKPIGQASVELLFENTDSINIAVPTLAQRTEVSVKRLVNREGQNSYFINGDKCRKKDVTDIFLGTGLGPRSYAIIEQGTISRLIESKPQELRVFIEEAAGISQYKDRRRETENKLKHTKENLIRVNDIKHELEQQVQKLSEQAESAQLFRKFKQQHRQLEAELLAMQWQQFEADASAIEQGVSEEQNDLKELSEQHSDIQSKHAELNEKIEQCHLRVAQLQEQQLSVDQQRVTLEQSLSHHQQRVAELEKQITNTEQQHNKFAQQSSNAKQKLIEIEAEIGEKLALAEHLEQNGNLSQAKLKEQQNALYELDQQYSTKQQELNIYYEQQKLQQRELEVFKTQQSSLKLQQERLEQQLSELSEKSQRSVNEQENIDYWHEQESHWQQELKLFQSQLMKLTAQQPEYIEKLANQKITITNVEQQIDSLDAQFEHPDDWQNQLIEQQLVPENSQTMAQLWQVEPAWQYIFDHVFSSYTNLIAVDELPEHLAAQSAYLSQTNQLTKQVVKGTLGEKIDSPIGFPPKFNDIFVEPNLVQAKQRLKQLPLYQSVICPDGTWLGHGFLIKAEVNKQSTSSLVLRQQLKDLQTEYPILKKQLSNWQKEYQQLKLDIDSLTEAIEKANKKLSEASNKIHKIQQQIQLEQQQEQWQEKQVAGLTEQLNQCQKAQSNVTEEMQLWLESSSQLSDKHIDKQALEELHQQKEQSTLCVKQLHIEVSQQQQSHKQLLLTIEHLREQHNLSSGESQHAAASLTLIEQQLTELKGSKSQLPCIQELASNVSTAQKKTQAIVESLASVKAERAAYKEQLSPLAAKNIKIKEQINSIEEKIVQARVQLEQYRVKRDAAQQQLAQKEINIADLITHIKPYESIANYQRQIKSVTKKIEQLGAINLTAIDDYELHISRKNELELQYDDLIQAIDTLESAIAKIDKESRHKFKSTFEQVNEDLQRLFPKVFGGGKAYLTLTNDDMLTSGVTVMAQPPGKKNSTIHLLSGGEKALTALSLVFAIFRLNPAPFCMLDEVDAPLDDANVSRFCNLVREMSQTVQFIFISHNKIAMEMASHLTGVTMFEPGVSRMVSVDIDEALAMAEVS